MSTGLPGLPWELKTIIYTSVLKYNNTLVRPRLPIDTPHSLGLLDDQPSPHQHHPSNHLGLLLSCRQLHNEALKLFYQLNAFEIRGPPIILERWQNQIYRTNRGAETSLSLSKLALINNLTISGWAVVMDRQSTPESIADDVHVLRKLLFHMTALECLAVRFELAPVEHHGGHHSKFYHGPCCAATRKAAFERWVAVFDSEATELLSSGVFRCSRPMPLATTLRSRFLGGRFWPTSWELRITWLPAVSEVVV
jgi:hypothetical protein